jgi:DNA-3-methyladenine glycosylase I
MAEDKKRCAWGTQSELYIRYHDEEWGRPVRDDQRLFEMLVLETMQAGLSWLTILRKRENFRKAFDGFDTVKILGYGEEKIAELLADSGIIRNRLKIRAVISNTRAFVAVQQEFGSFAAYLWGFVNDQPIQNHWQTVAEIPVTTGLSDKISADLKKRGFKFVGSTCIYAYMQSIGMVNDHTTDCFVYQELTQGVNQ